MRVQLYVQRMIDGKLCHPYEVVDLPDDEATLLVAAGSAVLADKAPQLSAPQRDRASEGVPPGSAD